MLLAAAATFSKHSWTGVELVGVVTRSPGRRAQVEADLPGVPVHDSLGDLIAAGVDAVTITTPPETRRALVLEAIAGGVAVIADKPFAPSADGGRELAEAALDAGVALSVFHNRRWDADIRTLAAVIGSGELGELWRVESRFDLDEPGGLNPGPYGGLLRDLGAHLVDQLLWLLGPARTVHAQLDWMGTHDPTPRRRCLHRLRQSHTPGAPRPLAKRPRATPKHSWTPAQRTRRHRRCNPT